MTIPWYPEMGIKVYKFLIITYNPFVIYVPTGNLQSSGKYNTASTV